MDIELVEFLDDRIHIFANSFPILLLTEGVGHRSAQVCEELFCQVWLEVVRDLNLPITIVDSNKQQQPAGVRFEAILPAFTSEGQ